MVGFTEKLNEQSFGLLGQLGFFSNVAEVRFDYEAGLFGIAVVDPTGE